MVHSDMHCLTHRYDIIQGMSDTSHTTARVHQVSTRPFYSKSLPYIGYKTNNYYRLSDIRLYMCLTRKLLC